MHFGSVSAFPRYGRVAQLNTGEVLGEAKYRGCRFESRPVAK